LKQSTNSESIEPLRPDYHERFSFGCGEPSLDRYLQELAGQEIRRKTASVFVLTSGSPKVLGYYCLSQSSISLAELPLPVQKKLPRYPKVPATLMGRLAVDVSVRGRGYGEALLLDALHRCWSICQQIASYAMVVDVMETQPDPLNFYLNYGFLALPDQPRRLYLPLSTYEKLWVGGSG
jgi:GNAT superfamily N-acetyltransferase